MRTSPYQAAMIILTGAMRRPAEQSRSADSAPAKRPWKEHRSNHYRLPDPPDSVALSPSPFGLCQFGHCRGFMREIAEREQAFADTRRTGIHLRIGHFGQHGSLYENAPCINDLCREYHGCDLDTAATHFGLPLSKLVTRLNGSRRGCRTRNRTFRRPFCSGSARSSAPLKYCSQPTKRELEIGRRPTCKSLM